MNISMSMTMSIVIDDDFIILHNYNIRIINNDNNSYFYNFNNKKYTNI